MGPLRFVVPLTPLGLGLALAGAFFGWAALRSDNGEGGGRRPTPIERLLSDPSAPAAARILLTEPREPFLEDIPRFPGSRLVAAMLHQGEASSYQVLWEVDAHPERVMAYLKEHLQAKGWSVEDVSGLGADTQVVNLCRDGEANSTFGSLMVGAGGGQAETDVRLFYSVGTPGECPPQGDGTFAPIELPYSLPVFPGAAGYGSSSSLGPDRTSIEYEYSVGASVGDVADFYQSALAGEGWLVTGSAATSDAAVIRFEDGATALVGFVSIAASDVGGGTEFRVSIVRSGP